jgi:hypothetical protein
MSPDAALALFGLDDPHAAAPLGLGAWLTGGRRRADAP